MMDVMLRELIDQIREDLLSPSEAATPEAKYPFLFVEEVNVEVDVSVSKKADGSGKVSIKVVELGGGIERADQKTHRVKIRLTPLLTKEEVRKKLKRDGQLWAQIESTVTRAATKESGMVGSDD